MNLLGLHHVTAIAEDPRRNVDFYTRVLGLRLVKKTVNFDDPNTYHFYYGDANGSPGSILTFFPWSGLRRGRPGNGQVYAIAFSVGRDSLPFWNAWLLGHGVHPSGPVDRFGEAVLSFTDPDGLPLELIANGVDPRTDSPSSAAGFPAPRRHAEIPTEHAIRGFHSVTIAVIDAARTQKVLTETMNYRVAQTTPERTRLAVGDGMPGTYVDLLTDRSIPRGLPGAGTVHHVAFRTPTDADQTSARDTLLSAGYHVSPVMDRNYFHSIYYREPEGVLFEIATDPPGFAIDEPVDKLGTSLKLPTQYEAHRREIEAALPSLDAPDRPAATIIG